MVRQVLLAAMIAGTVGNAAAQPPAPPPQRPAAQGPAAQGPALSVSKGGRAGEESADVLPDAALANMLDTYAIVEAQRALTIDDGKYGTFAARLKKLQDIRRRNQRQRQMLVRELFRMAGPRALVPADESAIRNQLMALREHDDRFAVELRQAYDALDEVLDTRQQARFRMFEEQIERRKLDLLVRARARALQKQPQE
jgi:hypothetical protein